MELEKRVDNNYYTPNNFKENLIDAIIALTTTVSTVGFLTYNYYNKVEEVAYQAVQLATNIYEYIVPFINS